jgi:hypothetical protein
VFPRQITHQNIFRVLIAGFGLVILLLVAAAVVGIRNIQSIRENAEDLVREQSVTNRLIDELQSQQTSLSEVFSLLARDPDSVDYDKIMAQLNEADRDIDRIAQRVAHDIRNQYTIQYSASNTAMDGTFRQIKVTVNAPGKPTPRTRSGYYASPDQANPKGTQSFK